MNWIKTTVSSLSDCSSHFKLTLLNFSVQQLIVVSSVASIIVRRCSYTIKIREHYKCNGIESTYQKCPSCRSQHYDSLQQAESQQQQQQHHQQQKQPLKDTTNTPPKLQKLNNNNEEDIRRSQEPESTQDLSSDPRGNQQQGSRSLQCLETLAQKAGIHDITADDCKYDVANTLLNLERGHESLIEKIEYKPFLGDSMSDIKTQQQQVGTL